MTLHAILSIQDGAPAINGNMVPCQQVPGPLHELKGSIPVISSERGHPGQPPFAREVGDRTVHATFALPRALKEAQGPTPKNLGCGFSPASVTWDGMRTAKDAADVRGFSLDTYWLDALMDP